MEESKITRHVIILVCFESGFLERDYAVARFSERCFPAFFLFAEGFGCPRPSPNNSNNWDPHVALLTSLRSIVCIAVVWHAR